MTLFFPPTFLGPLRLPVERHIITGNSLGSLVQISKDTTDSPNSVGVRWDFEFIRECMKLNKIRPKFHFWTKKKK